MPELTPSTREAARRLGICHSAPRKALPAGCVAPKSNGAWDVAKVRTRLTERSDTTRMTATL
jgi:hypothetical protein